ncbi:uncharacterized protein [Euphorbia lathyris]|uniref:uncharacterized protein n=1 Tax=Euphorbia lathyris TaxID=212925 RepID=UPI003313FA8F
MTEQRYRDSRENGAPLWRPGIRENARLSPSYLSPTYSRPEPYRSREVPSREVPKSGRDVRSFCDYESRNPESGEYRQDLKFSGLNRINNPVHPERSLFGMSSSVPRGEYGGEREMQPRDISMSGFSESVVGIGENSTSMKKFQWDNLLVDTKPANYADSNRTNYGGYRDSGVVPVSMAVENNGGVSSVSCFNRRMETSESGRNYGLMDGKYAYASPNPYGVRGRTSIDDSTVGKREGDKNIDIHIYNENTFRNNMMNERRMLMEKDIENEKDVDCRSLKVNPENQREDFSFSCRNNHGCSVYADVVESMPMLYDEIDDSSCNSCHKQMISLEEALELGLEPNRIDNKKLLLSYHQKAIEDIYDSISGRDRDWTSEEIEKLAMLENSGRAMYQDRSRGSSATDSMAIHGNSFSSADVKSMSRRSSKSSKRDVTKRDLRERLRPALSVKQRLEFPSQVGKRQVASKNRKKYPWLYQINGRTVEDQKISVQELKFRDKELEEYAGTELKKYAETEPREDSEEFKNQVQRAFLKSFKFLNENSTDLRRYLEEGVAGSLKCCICGSSSKAYVDTLGLAQHAFFSCKSRTEHLGLYKAICVLMGWNSTIGVKGKWIREILPSAEASSVREDLIIWPPVVLIHCNSLANDNKHKHMTVSIEGLKHILKGMGCDPRMTNISHGKAADQSSMVVSFSGTLSGLQEAENLHNRFLQNQHGRNELQQIRSSSHNKNHQETQNVLSDNIESFLYGYMGIASDLDKLDSETKRRSVVRSKKDMEAIADASIKTQ